MQTRLTDKALNHAPSDKTRYRYRNSGVIVIAWIEFFLSCVLFLILVWVWVWGSGGLGVWGSGGLRLRLRLFVFVFVFRLRLSSSSFVFVFVFRLRLRLRLHLGLGLVLVFGLWVLGMGSWSRLQVIPLVSFTGNSHNSHKNENS
jgi:hypothetical protein